MTLIITGTGTGVGKTVFAAALAGALDGAYWKPVQAGLVEETDSEIVVRLSGLPKDRIHPEAYRLRTPCSPHRAAALDGMAIDPASLSLPIFDRRLIVEGAGGVLVPLTGDLCFVDVFAKWRMPVVIVAPTGLGTINHSLLTIEALRRRSIEIRGIAFTGDPNEDSETLIARLGAVLRLGRLPHLGELTAGNLARAFAANFDIRDFRK